MLVEKIGTLERMKFLEIDSVKKKLTPLDFRIFC